MSIDPYLEIDLQYNAVTGAITSLDFTELLQVESIDFGGTTYKCLRLTGVPAAPSFASYVVPVVNKVSLSTISSCTTTEDSNTVVVADSSLFTINNYINDDDTVSQVFPQRTYIESAPTSTSLVLSENALKDSTTNIRESTVVSTLTEVSNIGSISTNNFYVNYHNNDLNNDALVYLHSSAVIGDWYKIRYGFIGTVNSGKNIKKLSDQISYKQVKTLDNDLQPQIDTNTTNISTNTTNISNITNGTTPTNRKVYSTNPAANADVYYINITSDTNITGCPDTDGVVIFVYYSNTSGSSYNFSVHSQLTTTTSGSSSGQEICFRSNGVWRRVL